MGRGLITPGASAALEEAGVSAWEYLCRHSSGDWGVLDAEDKVANDDAVLFGGRILSAYELPMTDVKIWIITEADRSATTILLPSEY
jgi:hypothetical protein